MEIRELITEFSKTKPESDIIVGYGSKVKEQANDKGIPRQIDLIFGVDNALEWHKQNHAMNPGDYRSKLGYRLLSTYINFGTKINYISYLPFKNQMFKIGVVETKDLICDLTHWENFFLAGRFQKPIQIIKGIDELDTAISINRMNALKVALLSSGKESISERELYETLCSLSFIGDWRNILHIETQNKVKNIVEGSLDELSQMYDKYNDGYYEKTSDGRLIINYRKLLDDALNNLPNELRVKLLSCLFNQINDVSDINEVKSKVSKAIIGYFTVMNLKASAAQPIKGLLLNGGGKSLTYINHKLAKK